VFRPCCFRLASLAENATAQRSVDYLTRRRKPTAGSPKRFGKRKVGNRPPGGYVGASRQLDRQHTSAKPTHPTFWAFWYINTFSAPAVFVLLRSPKTQPPSGRLTTLRVGASRQLDRQHAPAKPKRPTFWVFWFCRCVFRPICFRLAPLAENVTAQRSVTHLTLSSSGRLPTLRLPTRLGVPFFLVWFYSTQRRAGCPRSSPSSPPRDGLMLPILSLLTLRSSCGKRKKPSETKSTSVENVKNLPRRNPRAWKT
jgi:hypothetical protein